MTGRTKQLLFVPGIQSLHSFWKRNGRLVRLLYAWQVPRMLPFRLKWVRPLTKSAVSSPSRGEEKMAKARKMEKGREYPIYLMAHPMTDGRIYLNSEELKGFRYVIEQGQPMDTVIPALQAFASLFFRTRIDHVRPVQSARAAAEDHSVAHLAFIAEAASPLSPRLRLRSPTAPGICLYRLGSRRTTARRRVTANPDLSRAAEAHGVAALFIA